MRSCLFPILVILTICCRKSASQWQTLDFGSFTINTPRGWSIVKAKGIDSYVGGLTNGEDSLWFDYGWYSPEVGDEDPSKHQFARDTINGLVADLVIPIKPGDGNIRMSMPINRDDKFSIGGYNIKSTDTILKIFKTIVFEGSDTSINSTLTLSKFKQSLYANGKMIFKQYCASCHALHKTLVGPALSSVAQERSAEWLMKFITNRQLVAGDTILAKQKRDFRNGECMQFPEIKKEQAELLIAYIKNEK